MYSKKMHIANLLAAKQAVDEQNDLESTNRMIFVTAAGIIEGSVVYGIDIPDEGTPEEICNQMFEDNPGQVTYFDMARFSLLKIESPESEIKIIEAITLEDVNIQDISGNAYSISHLLLFTDQIIGCMPLDGK